MEKIKFEGKVTVNDFGCESSLIIPVGNLRVMLLSEGIEGKINHTEIIVYHKDDTPSKNMNMQVFGREIVEGNSETLDDALSYCKRLLRRNIR